MAGGSKVFSLYPIEGFSSIRTAQFRHRCLRPKTPDDDANLFLGTEAATGGLADLTDDVSP
jgi:hypothetical protein